MAITAPSNSVPLPVLIVVGEKAFQTIVSQIFVAIKREIPIKGILEPRTSILES